MAKQNVYEQIIILPQNANNAHTSIYSISSLISCTKKKARVIVKVIKLAEEFTRWAYYNWNEHTKTAIHFYIHILKYTIIIRKIESTLTHDEAAALVLLSLSFYFG